MEGVQYENTTDDTSMDTSEPTTLTAEELAHIATLLTQVAENPFSYETQVEYITLLRRGLDLHRKSPNAHPSRYPLWNDLKAARLGMLERYRLTEDMFAEWIEDENEAGTDWSEVKTIFDAALELEPEFYIGPGAPSSTRLWKLYAEWTEEWARKVTKRGNITPDELDMFNNDAVLSTWETAVEQTKGAIHDSDLVWNGYRDAMMRIVEQHPEKRDELIKHVFQAYENRLGVVHSTLSQTFTDLSTFVTDYFPAEDYESTMVNANKVYAATNKLWEDREIFEARIKNARLEGNIAEEWMAFAEYIEWEKQSYLPKKTGRKNKAKATKQDRDDCAQRVIHLFERASLRWPTEPRVWEEMIFYALENNSNVTKNIAMLGRAALSCPWSGSLWSILFNALETAFKPFETLSAVKDKAMESGILENVGGKEEVLKLQVTWLNYQRRRATSQLSDEDEIELAELEVEQGAKTYGSSDSNFRLDRIWISLLCDLDKVSEARDVWKGLVQLHGDSHQFWLRWYTWEREFGEKKDVASLFNMAFQRIDKKLDWPEKIVETWKEWVEDECDAEDIQNMLLKLRKHTASIAERRQKEAEQAAASGAQAEAVEAAPVAQPAVQAETMDVEMGDGSGKRKFEDDTSEERDTKKAKSEDIPELPDAPNPELGKAPLPEASALKRDRENTTVIVRNLPADIEMVKVRQFFRDCGIINSLKLVKEADGNSSTATIEFDSLESVAAAKTRDMKKVGDNEISIQVGTGSTLYVTNFPPTADDGYIRKLFEPYGTIVDIRFPSLRYNTHRRFCYVQFTSATEARSSLALDGRKLGEKLNLSVKISDPNQKKDREGPVYEGREVFIRNIDFKVREDDIRAAFEKFGTIERINLPAAGPKKGTHKGFGFVVFSKKEEADASLALNKIALKSRMLDVSIATPNPGKVKFNNAVTGSASPEPDAMATDEPTEPSNRPTRDEINKKTFAILNLPDTINDARLRAILDPYGPLHKLTLRPDHAGAIVEYESVADAGKASMALPGTEIGGSTIRIGSVSELKQSKPVVRKDKGFESKKKQEEAKKEEEKKEGPRPKLFAPTSVSVRGRRQGGGMTRRGGFVGMVGKKVEEKKVEEKKEGDVEMGDADAGKGEGDGEKKGKSNEEFRKMFLK
ncbi:hypothetical protein BJ508DRAFT_378905 [Ascobolus immersus RN42]|uniref:U4/U6 snRNA-associated-splicing factor PRP24 n=1 Tax=Ascobolus immersus RN42 TaxID=1160509 RepID=A0A3N4I6D9_ASCIM|nr:hypothetical protein BJ508DRAFT_378905 [Ascobolus immersus RN42]